ncbi:MAG: LEPR-XLL domain-containing protein, partial [Limisphaerales bacterium]
MKAAPPTKRSSQFELENLEQRILLSGNALIEAAVGAHAGTDPHRAIPQSVIEENGPASAVETTAPAAYDPASQINGIFDGIFSQPVDRPAAESTPASESKSAPAATVNGAEQSAQKVAVSDVFQPGKTTAGTDVLNPAGSTTDSSNPLTLQLTETLHAANSPPTEHIGSQFVTIDSKASSSGEAISLPLTASLDSASQGSDSSTNIHLTPDQPLQASGGLTLGESDTLSGTGTVLGSVTSQGTISPGNSPGVQYFGSLTLGASAVTVIQLFGTTPASTLNWTGTTAPDTSHAYDQIIVSRAASLGGTLAITLGSGYTPQEGDTFDIITASSFTGHFVTGTGLFGFGDHSLYLKVEQLPDRLRLVATKVSADAMVVRPDTQAGNDAFGQLLNHDQFATSSASFVGSVTVGQFVSIHGTLNLTWVPSLSVTLTDKSTTTLYGLTIGGTGLDVFVGLGGPYLQDSNGDGSITNADSPNPNATGLHFTNVNVGLGLFRSFSLLDYSTYYALSVTASTGALVGSDTLTAQANNISVGVDEVRATIDNAVFPAPAINFSALPGGGLNVPTGGATTVKLDFNQRFQRASVADLTLQVSQYVYARGSFTFEKGTDLTVPLTGGSAGRNGTTDVEVMTIGASNVHVFVGVGGPYWQDSNGDGQITSADTPDANAIGLALDSVDLGLAVMKEKALVSPNKYTALKVTAASAAFVGGGDYFQMDAKGISIGVNQVSALIDNTVSTAAVIDFSSMNGGAGFQVNTGGTPVTLDFNSRIIRASVTDATVQIYQFVYARGSFAFEKSADLTVPLIGGSAGRNGTTTVEVMTIGGSNVHLFVGVGGPYWQDSNGDGQITNADTPDANAIGLALDSVDIGLAVMKEKALVSPNKFTALKVTAASAGFVGGGDYFKLDANGISIGVNQVSALVDNSVSTAAVVDFSSMNGGAGFQVNTGGTPVTLDFNSRIIRASVADATVQVSQFVYARGSFAF